MAIPTTVAKSTAVPTWTEKALAKVWDYLQLSKFRLSALVVATAGFGYLLALPTPLSSAFGHWLLMLLGTFGVVAAANAFNQVLERDVDALMSRTATRPLPAQRMSVTEAVGIASAMAVGGLLLLVLTVHWLAAIWALFALLVYVLAYTPLKRTSELCTFVGAIAGAVPPVIGWLAASNEFSAEAAVLFALQFLWQFPHFWAIAWMYRDDYAKAGFKMLPVTGDGKRVAQQMVGYTFALTVVSLLPALLGWVTPHYLLGASAVGVWLLRRVFAFCHQPTTLNAKRLLMTANAYLPLLLVLWWVFRSA